MDCVEEYYTQKKALATGCEPPALGRQLDTLKDLLETAWLAGAGGGGFLYVWLKEGTSLEEIREHLVSTKWEEEALQEPGQSVHRVEVDNEPLQVDVQNLLV